MLISKLSRNTLTCTTYKLVVTRYAYQLRYYKTMPKPPEPALHPLPHNIQLLSTPLTTAIVQQLQQRHTIRHKQIHYGDRLLNEDNKFGLPVPPPIPDYIQSIVNTYSTYTQSHTINRVSIRTIHPGAHTKPCIESNVYEPILILVPVGSHLAVQIQPVDTNDNTVHTHNVLVPDSCALLITDTATQQYQWHVVGKTRDWIDDKQVKRKECLFVELRHIKSTTEQQVIGETHQSNNTIDDNKIVAVPVTDTTVLNQSIESQHVHNVYDSIAGHFSSTRHTPWPKIDHFVRCIPAHSVVADVGCGNGKYMGLNKDITVVGCDLSAPLVQICQQRGYIAVVADALNIPFRSDYFDFVLNIAVLHHISTIERRQQIVRELLRICRTDGQILVSAWAFEQDSTSRRSFPTQDVYVPWNVPSRHYKPEQIQNNNDTNQNKLSSTDIDELLKPKLVTAPNTEELIVVHRYCHVYKEGELEELFTSTGQCKILKTYYDRGNWCILVQKT